jgi:hypothetical protein
MIVRSSINISLISLRFLAHVETPEEWLDRPLGSLHGSIEPCKHIFLCFAFSRIVMILKLMIPEQLMF